MNLSNTIKTLIRRILFTIRRVCIRKPYFTIIRMDGGICSQMWQYLIGIELSKQGRHILYDISWFSDNGKDLDGNDNRKFDLLKLFPDLEFKEAGTSLLQAYRVFCKFIPPAEDIMKISALNSNIPTEPVYMAGYYFPEHDVYQEYERLFNIQLDRIVGFGENNLIVAKQILANDYSVGVHVRRGDMANRDGYWTKLGPQYFINAIKLYDQNKYKFYFFSEDLKWCQQYICSAFENLDYQLVDINDSAHGYCDLALLSLCKIQIISQGSFGGIANLINQRPDKEMVVPDIQGGYRYHPKAERWEDVSKAIIRKASVV